MKKEKAAISFDDLISEITNTEKKFESNSMEELDRAQLMQRLEELRQQVILLKNEINNTPLLSSVNNESQKKDSAFKEHEYKTVNDILNNNIELSFNNLGQVYKSSYYSSPIEKDEPDVKEKDDKSFLNSFYAYIFLAYIEKNMDIFKKKFKLFYSISALCLFLLYILLNPFIFFNALVVIIAFLCFFVLIEPMFKCVLNQNEKKAFQNLSEQLNIEYTIDRSILNNISKKNKKVKKPLSYYYEILNIDQFGLIEQDLKKEYTIQEVLLLKPIEDKLFKLLNIKNEIDIKDVDRVI